jgi:hypothetical protein
MGFEALKMSFEALEINLEALETCFGTLKTGFEVGHSQQGLRRVTVGRV